MSIVTDNWSKIWNGKQADEQLLNRDFETVFMELKRLTGNDTTGGNGVTFDGFKDQYFRIKKYLRSRMWKRPFFTDVSERRIPGGGM